MAISIYNRLQDKDEMSGYTNFATVRYYFEARVLTGYKPVFFTSSRACACACIDPVSW